MASWTLPMPDGRGHPWEAGATRVPEPKSVRTTARRVKVSIDDMDGGPLAPMTSEHTNTLVRIGRIESAQSKADPPQKGVWTDDFPAVALVRGTGRRVKETRQPEP